MNQVTAFRGLTRNALRARGKEILQKCITEGETLGLSAAFTVDAGYKALALLFSYSICQNYIVAGTA
jgi:hypothetical protein